MEYPPLSGLRRPTQMQYRKLGTSELEVPVVSFGAWAIGGWMWGGSDEQAAIRAIQTGIDAGITCIDTAPVYGMGLSEQIVGKAIKGRRDTVIIATKCGLRWDEEEGIPNEGEFFFDTVDNTGAPAKIFKNLRMHSIEYEVEASLRRLGVDYIDLYQCHWPDSTTPLEETMTALKQLQDMGKIRAIGVSNFTPAMLQESRKYVTIASDQPKYNALERAIEYDLLPYCRAEEIGVLAYSPIAQGLLTGKVSLDREFPEGDVRRNKPLFSRENRKKVLGMLKGVQPIADAHNCTLGQLFIAWLVAQPGITSALVGARNERQVAENAAAGELNLGAEELQLIRTEVEALGQLA